MVQTITAVYENGVLYPKVPLALQEQTEVQIQIITDANESTSDNDINLAEQNEALDREMDAYIEMHSELKKQYLGKHVAIFEGKLIDSDGDYGTLYERILEEHPDSTVWISTVREEAVPTIHMRSPRFIQDPQ